MNRLFGGGVTIRILSFSDLAAEDINAVRIEAVERRWKDGNVNRYPAGRSENILSYTIEGAKVINGDKEGQSFSCHAPVILFISKKTPYASRTVATPEQPEGHTICVRFALQTDAGEEVQLKEAFRLWESDPDGKLLRLFRALLSAYLAPDTGPMLLKARLFDLLSALCGRQSEQQMPVRYRRLLPAIRHIEQNLAQNTSIAQLASLCFMSESYFRACFREFQGCSPTDYKNRLRVEKAQELLESSLWTTDLIAERLGFCDTAHFCHIYKKFTGTTPRNTKV